MECFRCGTSAVRLFDAISREGIVRVCKQCASEENMPMIKKPTGFGPIEEKKETVRQVLSRISGIEKREEIPKKEINPELERQQIKLKEIADRNLQKAIQEKPISIDGLVDNFHWILMRVRRKKKMTQEELAGVLAEPEAAIKMAEQGIISSSKLIEKLENYLNIKLRKDVGDMIIQDVNQRVQKELFPSLKKQIPIETQEKSKLELSFDPTITKSLTIADLKEMKKKRKEEILKKEEKEKPFDEKELTDKDIDDILFGRK